MQGSREKKFTILSMVNLNRFFKIVVLVFSVGLVSCGGGGGGLPEAAAGDINPPAIKSIKPTSGSNNVDINSFIEIEFGEAIVGFDTNNILILSYASITDTVPTVSVELNSNDLSFSQNTLIVKPGLLSANTKYHVVVKDLKDVAGNKMIGECQWDFATASISAEVYSGTVSNLTTGNCGFSGPPPLPPLTTANVLGGVYNSAQSITLTCIDSTGERCTNIYYSLDNSTPSIVYESPISIATLNTIITLQYFGVNSAGLNETIKSQVYTIINDTINLTVTSVVPTEGGTITVNQDIVMSFSQPVNESSLTGNVRLYEMNGVTQGIESTLTLTSNTALTEFRITPTNISPVLTPVKNYQLVVLGGTNGVQDANGLTMLSDSITNFRTISATDKWTWIAGSQTANAASIYSGTIPPPYPGSRYLQTTAWNTPNGLVWIFGGFDSASGGYRNDLWRYDPSNSTWSEVSNNRAINTAGQYSGTTLYPGARSASSTWTDLNGNLWLFGGTGFDSTGSAGRLNDLWKYDPAINQWTWISGSDLAESTGNYDSSAGMALQPSARYGASSWYSNTGELWLFGGRAGPGTFNDLWKFTPASTIGMGTWTWVGGSQLIDQPGIYTAPTPTPGAHLNSAQWKDKQGNFWLFGGTGTASQSGGYLNDLWQYNPVDGTWAFMGGSTSGSSPGSYGQKLIPDVTNIPSARGESVSWVDSQGNLWLYGGQGYVTSTVFGKLSDLWKFDGTIWTWMNGNNTVNQAPDFGTLGSFTDTTNPGARYSSVGWTDSNDNLWLFSGYVTNLGPMNDLWKYTP